MMSCSEVAECRYFTGGGNGAESRNEGKEQKSGKAEHGKAEKRNRKWNRLGENMVYDIPSQFDMVTSIKDSADKTSLDGGDMA